MKDDLFDDLIKHKLDSEDVPFSVSEVRNIHQHVRANLPLAHPKFKYSRVVANTLMSAVIGATSVLFVFQKQKNDRLQSEVDEIKIQQQEFQKQNRLLIDQNSQMGLELAKLKMESAQKLNLQVNVPQKKEMSQKVQFNSKEKIAVSADLSSNSQKLVNPILADYQEVSEKMNQVGELEKNKKDSTVVISQIEKIGLTAKPTKDTSAVKDSVLDAQKMLKKYQYAAGMMGNVGIGEKGFGMMATVLKNHRWQFQIGIKLSSMMGKSYYDEEEFKRTEKSSFAAEYTGVNSGHMHDYKNIQFNYRVIQIPLSVSYLMPLKKDLWFVTGLGTKLSLRSYEAVAFRAKNWPGNQVVTQEVNMIKTNFPKMHDVSISLGLQHQWNRFVLQSMMYFEKSFNEVKFKPMSATSGISLQISYLLNQ